MKKILTISAVLLLFAAVAKADDRPISMDQLPAAARTFINTNYPEVQVLFSTKDDDIVLPDYNVALANGVSLEFYNDGALKKIESRDGVPSDLVPVQIVEFVKVRYPDAYFVSYEVDKRHYEVTLSNRLDLKFNKNYNLIEIDD
ncbi:MAG: PepSY-like domain-containing protein [Bacteroidales bacterium]|nr:PepSY-like domain-containing protein [Bacteroidales bacterium]MBP3661545.1 PepSY-like domain-containing protein [Bacteroidales bacterium]